MFHVNEGPTDRTIRIVLGILLIILGIININYVYQVTSLVLGAILLITGVTGFCGLYNLLGISTCPVKTKSSSKTSQNTSPKTKSTKKTTSKKSKK